MAQEACLEVARVVMGTNVGMPTRDGVGDNLQPGAIDSCFDAWMTRKGMSNNDAVCTPP